MSSTAQQSHPFPEDFVRYRERVLEPLGLAPPESAVPFETATPETSVFGTNDRVWKFYRPPLALHARNCAKILKLLADSGLPAPTLLHAEVAHAGVERFGGSCIVMERVHGARLDRAELTRRGSPVASALARFHEVHSDRWGLLTWVRSDRNPGSFLAKHASCHLQGINELLPRWNLSPIEGGETWFEQNSPRLAPEGHPLSLTHTDLHAKNILVGEDRSVYFIDLDLTGFRAFGIDLAELHEQIGVVPPLGASREEALDAWEEPVRPFLEDYFHACGDDREALWAQMRDVCFLHVCVRRFLQCLREEAETVDRGEVPAPLLVERNRARHAVIQTFLRS